MNLEARTGTSRWQWLGFAVVAVIAVGIALAIGYLVLGLLFLSSCVCT